MSRTKQICQLSEIDKLRIWARLERKFGSRHKAVVLEIVATRMELRKKGLAV
jgi:hypothetical protein